MVDKPEKINIQSLKNIRDLSYLRTKDGKRIRRGKLLRSETLYNIPESEMKYLYEEYSLRKIIDIRGNNEVSEKPDTLYEGVEYIRCNLQEERNEMIVQDEEAKKKREEFAKRMKDAQKNIDAIMEWTTNFYRDITGRETAVQGFRKFFSELMSCEGATLWHCSLGKDRTGMFAAAVLEALGVDREDIYSDYLYTNVNRNESMGIFGEAHREFLEAFYEGVEKRFGSVDQFLEAIGVDKVKLREKYLED